MKEDQISFDEKEFKDQFYTWKNIQAEWLINLQNLKQSVDFLRIKKAYQLLKNINYCEKTATEFSDSFVAYANQLMRQLQAKGVHLKLLSFNETLEEMYMYLMSESPENTQEKDSISNYNQFVRNILSQKDRMITNEDIKSILEYASMMVNYHEYVLSMTRWMILKNRINEIQQHSHLDDKFKIQMQTNRSTLNKIKKDIDTYKEQPISEKWLFIDRMQEEITKNWKSCTLNEWIKNNKDFIEQIYNLMVEISNKYKSFKETKKSKNLYWISVISTNWEKETKALLKAFSLCILKDKNNYKKGHQLVQTVLTNYLSFLKQLLTWIQTTQNFINDFHSIVLSQTIMRIKNADLINQLEFLNREYVPNRDELSVAEQVLKNMREPFTLEDNKIMNLAAITINQFLDYNYRQQSYQIIARELWKELNRRETDIFTDDEWSKISSLYRNIEYKKFIEQTAKICRKLKMA